MCNVPIVDLVCYLKYGKDCFRESCKKIRIMKSIGGHDDCSMKLYGSQNPVTTVNDCWPAVILSTVVFTVHFNGKYFTSVFQNMSHLYISCHIFPEFWLNK